MASDQAKRNAAYTEASSTKNHKNSEMQTGDCLHHFCHADLFSTQSLLQD